MLFLVLPFLVISLNISCLKFKGYNICKILILTCRNFIILFTKVTFIATSRMYCCLNTRSLYVCGNNFRLNISILMRQNGLSEAIRTSTRSYVKSIPRISCTIRGLAQYPMKDSMNIFTNYSEKSEQKYSTSFFLFKETLAVRYRYKQT